MLSRFLSSLNTTATLSAAEGDLQVLPSKFDPRARQQRQLEEIDRHNQRLLARSAQVRQAFLAGLDSSSVERHEATKGPYLEHLRRDAADLRLRQST